MRENSSDYLVYSTCSIFPEENEFLISKVFTENDDVNILQISDKIGEKDYLGGKFVDAFTLIFTIP